MKTRYQLQKEFGARLISLHDGQAGLRGGLACTVKDVGDGDEPVMDFIGSDGALDRYNEVIQPAGWQLDNFRANPVIPDCHDYSSIAKILGRAESVSVTGGKLVNRVRFCVDNPMGNLCWKMARGGFIRSQSVGFIPLEWVNGNESGQPDRTYTKQELLEISMVVVPANPAATIGLALKSGAVDGADLKSLADFLKEFCSNPAVPKTSASASGLGRPLVMASKPLPQHDAGKNQLANGDGGSRHCGGNPDNAPIFPLTKGDRSRDLLDSRSIHRAQRALHKTTRRAFGWRLARGCLGTIAWRQF
jgi:Caudovirus prohead serine protease